MSRTIELPDSAVESLINLGLERLSSSLNGGEETGFIKAARGECERRLLQRPVPGTPFGHIAWNLRGIYINTLLDDAGQPYNLVLVTDSAGKPIVIEDVEWGCYGKEIKGCDSFRDSKANTDAMLAAGSPLAKAVRAYGDDCQLPSLCEAQAVFAIAQKLLPAKIYWTSTQDGAVLARSQGFESGYSYWYGKNYRFHAFVVRRVRE